MKNVENPELKHISDIINMLVSISRGFQLPQLTELAGPSSQTEKLKIGSHNE